MPDGIGPALLIWLYLVLCLGVAAPARATLAIPAEFSSINLRPQVEVVEDPAGTL